MVAGPGTGKTRTLVERIADLVERRKVPPKEITAVTFTHQAAEEMRTRLKERLGSAAKPITVGTFHAIALKMLKKKPLFSREQALALMAELLEERGEKTSPAEMLRLLSQVKNGVEVPGFPHGLREAYDDRMHGLGARDLDDLLTEALRLDESRKACFRHLLVDEFQDINPLQHRLVEHWRQGSLFVIGDPDQSIYGFRGADADCFDRLRERHPNLQADSSEGKLSLCFTGAGCRPVRHRPKSRFAPAASCQRHRRRGCPADAGGRSLCRGRVHRQRD